MEEEKGIAEQNERSPKISTSAREKRYSRVLNREFCLAQSVQRFVCTAVKGAHRVTASFATLLD